MKLDKNKSYGEVIGISQARFEQDGVLFDALGDEIKSDKRKVSKPDSEASDESNGTA